MKNRGFTLAEIMIVLSIIGILTAILLPIANHSRPDESVMKFKKADTTLKNVIRELVNSDKYYVDGDLGMKRLANGTGQLIDGTHELDNTYFCNSFGEIITAKKINCLDDGVKSQASSRVIGDASATVAGMTIKEWVDYHCKNTTSKSRIITTDGISYFETAPKVPFGIATGNAYNADGSDGNCPDVGWCSQRLFSGIEWSDAQYHGFDVVYKDFCIDIDGVPESGSKNCDDIKDICPFGYGIRADGKILTGKRADEWLEKDFQKGKNK